MEKLKKWDSSEILFRIVVIGSGILFFLLNMMMPYISDDFAYLFSFKTGERIRNLRDIAFSMYAHAFTMNGRLVPHAVEQFFLLLPKIAFNLCNTLMFIWLMLSGYYVSSAGKKHSTVLYLVIFMCFWNCVPAFGQSCLWQDGALNYLWGLGFSMLFLRPYFAVYFEDADGPCFRVSHSKMVRLLYVIAAFFFGMYTEISSFVSILLAAGIYIAVGREKRNKNRWLIWPLLLAAVGFLVLFSIPAEHNKGGDMQIEALLSRIPDVIIQMKEQFSILYVGWVVLFVLANERCISRGKRLSSLGLLLGATAGSIMTIAANDYPYRCMITTTFFLILACASLLPELLESASGTVCRVAIAVLALTFSVNLICGVGDIGSAWNQNRHRKALIAEALDAGEREISLPIIFYSTKYSPYFEQKDLDQFDPDSWPNIYMAQYYGFERIYRDFTSE